MNRSDGVKIELIVAEPWSAGGKVHRFAYGTADFPIFSERLVDEMTVRSPVGPAMPFKEAVRVIKDRRFRRELLREAAIRLAERMADHLEDAEGWHGERRRERIKTQSATSAENISAETSAELDEKPNDN